MEEVPPDYEEFVPIPTRKEEIPSVNPAPLPPRWPETHLFKPVTPILEEKEAAVLSLAVNSTDNVTNDLFQDTETSIVSLDTNGQTFVTTAYFKFENPQTGQLRPVKVRYFTTTANGSQQWTGMPTLPAGFNSASFDPYLAVNPFTSEVFPKTVYLVALAERQGDSNSRAIVGWRSTDGGVSWSSPGIIATGDIDS
ncbi:MAG: hypothetical protein ACPW60_04010 [Methylohalobius sp. ZOD2]